MNQRNHDALTLYVTLYKTAATVYARTLFQASAQRILTEYNTEAPTKNLPTYQTVGAYLADYGRTNHRSSL